MSGQNEVGGTENTWETHSSSSSSSPLPPPPPESNVVYVTGGRSGRRLHGRCPYCGIGRPVTDINLDGLLCAIICFIICLPIGVCCYYAWEETKCSRCKAPLAN